MMQLRWTLLKYFSPLEHLSEDTSSWNIFWSTAEAMYGSEAQSGDIQHEQARSIVANALKAEFELAAWPCPKGLMSISDMLILEDSHKLPAPIGFAMIPQHRTSTSADAQQAASDSRPATAARASGQLDESSRKTASKARRGVAADTSDGMADSHRKRRLESVWESSTPDIVGVLPRPEPENVADACPLLRQPAPASETAGPAKQFLCQLSMADFEAVDRLAQINMHSPLLARASPDLISSMRLPSGIPLQQLSTLETEQLDALSIQMAIAELPEAHTSEVSASSNVTDAFSSNSSRPYVPPHTSPAAAAEAAGCLEATLLPVGCRTKQHDHAASAATSREGSIHEHSSLAKLDAPTSALHAAAAMRSCSAPVSWQRVLEALLHHLSVEHILMAASANIGLNESFYDYEPHPGYQFVSTCRALHDFAERQFAIAAVVSTLRGRPVQLTTHKEEADNDTIFALQAIGGASRPPNADDAAKAARSIDARMCKAAGTCGWVGIKNLESLECKAITEHHIRQPGP